ALGPPTMSKTSSWVDGSIRKSDQASHRTSALALSKITRRTDLASRAEARARVVSVRRANSGRSARVRPCMPEGDLCSGVRLVRECPGVGISARVIHKCLLRQPILSPGGAFLVRPPRRTGTSTPVSSSLARSLGGLRSQPPRNGIHDYSELAAGAHAPCDLLRFFLPPH